MKPCIGTHKDVEGSALVLVLLILMLLTIGGIVATSTSRTELAISGNEKSHRLAFYAAEAARSYVAKTPDLYGSDNITLGTGPHYFPNDSNPYTPKTSDDAQKYVLSGTQSFNGWVEYLGPSTPPRGSGSQVGTFKAHKYRMTCYGYGPSNAESKVEVGFYRLGF